MLYWAAVFFVLAVVSAALGFGGIAASAAWMAKVLFVVFLGLFALSVIGNVVRRPALTDR